MSLKKIPTVPFRRFLKHSFEIVKNPLPFHHQNFEKLGDTFRLKIGLRKSVIFSRDAGLLQYVLQKNQRNYTKSPIQTADLAKYVGRGLLTAEGEHWRRQRKLIQPAFHKKQLIQLLDTMHRTIQTEIGKIETGKPFDIFPVFNDLAFQVVAKSLFSGAVSETQINRLQHITEAAQGMLVRELRQPYLHRWFRWSGTLEKYLKMTREARTILKSLVDERRRGQPQGDLLDMLLEARYDDGNPMDEEQLIDEMLILFTAGHETTSNALTFISQLLAQNLDYQKTIYKEWRQNRDLDLPELLRESGHAQRAIEEGLRLYPPAYFIDRVNLEDDEFEGKHFPKGTMLLFAVHEIHKNPDFWENPLNFRPERFAEKMPKDYASHYFPFGAGPRMCIGNNFAMYEMILAVNELVSKFIIKKKTDEIQIKPLITLKPKNAVLIFKKRK